jgi:hypothetical protein
MIEKYFSSKLTDFFLYPRGEQILFEKNRRKGVLDKNKCVIQI